MKVLKYILIAGVFLTAFSCKKSFLERYPTGQVSRDQLLSDIQGIKNSLVGTYTLVAGYHLKEYGIYGDLRGDDVELLKGAPNKVMEAEYNYDSKEDQSIGAVRVIWSDVLETLNNVNNIIRAIDDLRGKSGNEGNALDSLLGQALVLRAKCHFDLAQVYSQHYTYTPDASHLGVPVLLRSPAPGTLVARQNMRETYTQILKDLTDAIVQLEKHNPDKKTKVSSYAARALRSRIYLYMENWEEVVKDATDVLNTNKFNLVDSANYLKMFTDPAQRNAVITSEVIWQLNKNTPSKTDLNYLFSDFEEFCMAPTDNYRNLFESEDIRSKMFRYNSIKNRYYSLKYSLDPSITAGLWPVNTKVIRSAELYLNRAEANWHLKDYNAAVNDLKVIRARAYGKQVVDIVVTYTNPQDLLDQILLERRKELGFENQRIYDIVRNRKDLDRGSNCNAAKCKVTYPNNSFVLPIPLLELDANPAMQPNPGVNN